METPLQIQFRGIEASPALEAAVREHVEKLDTFERRIMSCRVVIEAAQRHHKQRTYHVRIDLTTPGAELVVGGDAAEHRAHEDAYVAVSDAFRAMGRRLEDHGRRRRGDVKTHEPPASARVTQLFADQGYGFLVTPDGRDVYFHRNAVVDGAFDRLSVGAEVRYVEEQGEKGPQASTVELVGRHARHSGPPEA